MSLIVHPRRAPGKGGHFQMSQNMLWTFRETPTEALSFSGNLLDFFGTDFTAFLRRELNRPTKLEHRFALLGGQLWLPS